MAIAARFPAPATIVVQVIGGKTFEFPDETAAAEFERKVIEAGGTAVRVNPPVPQLSLVARPLYELEDALAAMADTAAIVPAEQQGEFLASFQELHLATREKRDRTGQFIVHCLGMAQFGEKEIARIQRRCELYRRTAEKLTEYVGTILRNRGKDEHGKWGNLEGNTVTFTLKNLPPRTEITDEAALPTTVKKATVTLNAQAWHALLDSVDLDLRTSLLDAIQSVKYSAPLTDIKAAIAERVPDYLERLKTEPAVSCAEVPGAAIVAGGTKVVIS